MMLKNKHVLLTGAGSGIGRCLAAELAQQGALLILTDLDANALDETIAMYGIESQVIGTIVSNFLEQDAVQQLLKQVFTLTDRIDVLFCNAGMMAMGQVKNMPWSDFQRMQQVNQNTPIELTYQLLPRMIAQGGGHIAYTCSASALVSPPGSAFYSMTKAAIMAFSESLRAEVHSKNIYITTICPGFVRTPMAQNMEYRDQKSQDATQNVPAFIGVSPERVAKKAVAAMNKRQALVTSGSDETFKRWLRYVSYSLYSRFNRLFAKALLDD